MVAITAATRATDGKRGAEAPRPLTANNPAARARRNRPLVMQQRLKSLPRPARARVVAAELFDQFLFPAADEAQAALDACLAREALTVLGRHLETRARLADYALAFDFSFDELGTDGITVTVH
jgi:hypothetical protein